MFEPLGWKLSVATNRLWSEVVCRPLNHPTPDMDLVLLEELLKLPNFNPQIQLYPNGVNRYTAGWTMLQFAVWNNNFKLIRLLCQYGADPFHGKSTDSCFAFLADRKKDSQTSLKILNIFRDFGWLSGTPNLLKLCRKYDETILAAAKSYNLKLIAAYAEAGVSVDNRYEIISDVYQEFWKQDGLKYDHNRFIHNDKEYGEIYVIQPASAGESALMTIMKSGHKFMIPIIHTLIKSGADVNLKNREHKSVLNFACDTGNLKVIKLLIEQGADVHYRSDFINSGYSCLEFIYQFLGDFDVEFYQFIMKYGPELDWTQRSDYSVVESQT